MKPFLLTIAIVVSVGGLLAVGYFTLYAPPPPAPPDAVEPVESTEPPDPAPAPAPELRAYRTLRTLREDLRDALAGEGERLDAECWRVSALLKPAANAIRTLNDIAPDEKSPKVRGLLVLAAGVHAPDHPALARMLRDRFEVVREAAALAMGRSAPSGPVAGETLLYLDRVRVDAGRELAPGTRRALESALERETDERVRGVMRRVLGDA